MKDEGLGSTHADVQIPITSKCTKDKSFAYCVRRSETLKATLKAKGVAGGAAVSIPEQRHDDLCGHTNENVNVNPVGTKEVGSDETKAAHLKSSLDHSTPLPAFAELFETRRRD